MKKNFLSESLIVVSTVLWGLISLFSKPLMTMGFSSMQVVFIRLLFSAIMLAIFMVIYDKSLFKIKLKDLPIFLGHGVLGYVFCMYCYMRSIEENGAGVGAMLMYSAPIWTVVLSLFFFKEKITLFKLIALIGVVAGCIMVSLGGDLKISLIGVFLGIGSGIGLSLLSIFTKFSSNKGYASFTMQFYAFIFAVIVSFPISKAWKTPAMIATDYTSLLYFVLFALISTTLPYVLYGISMKNVTASTASILSSLEVVVGALVGFIAYNEHIGILGILGVIVMIGGLVFLALSGEKTKNIIESNKEKL